MEDNKEMRIYNALKIFFCVILLSMPYCASAYNLGTALVGKSEFVENDMYMLNIPQQDSVVPPQTDLAIILKNMSLTDLFSQLTQENLLIQILLA